MSYRSELRSSKAPFSESFFNYVVFFTFVLLVIWGVNSFFKFAESSERDDGFQDLKSITEFRTWLSAQDSDTEFWLGFGEREGKGIKKVSAFLLFNSPGQEDASVRLCGVAYHPTRMMLVEEPGCLPDDLWVNDLEDALARIYKRFGSDTSLVDRYEYQYTSFRRVMTFHMAKARRAGRI